MNLLLLTLLACPAEMLGIPLPEEGLDALTMEDVVRDAAGLTQGIAAADSPDGEEARRQFLATRWEQMGLEVEGWCGHRSGTTPERIAVVALPGAPGSESGWAGAVVAISLAKAVHGREADPRGAMFCVGSQLPEARHVLVLGPLGEAEPTWTGRAPHPALPALVLAPAAAADLRVAQGSPTGPMDYRRLEDVARTLVPVLEGWLAGG